MVSNYVVDGSVALKWLIDDEADVLRARAILTDILSGNARLVVPPHYVSEVGNGLIMASRRKRIVLHRLAEAWAVFCRFRAWKLHGIRCLTHKPSSSPVTPHSRTTTPHMWP